MANCPPHECRCNTATAEVNQWQLHPTPIHSLRKQQIKISNLASVKRQQVTQQVNTTSTSQCQQGKSKPAELPPAESSQRHNSDYCNYAYNLQPPWTISSVYSEEQLMFNTCKPGCPNIRPVSQNPVCQAFLSGPQTC